MRWASIKGYEGYYEVSDSGEIRSLHTYRGTIPGLKTKTLGKRGYFVVDLSVKQKRKNLKVHRLVAEAFIDNPDNKPLVNHIDGNKRNNVVSNLEWCSYRENAIHASKHGLLRPYNHDNARVLTPEIAIEIFNALGTHREISKRFGVGQSTVAHIKVGTRWGKFTKKR